MNNFLRKPAGRVACFSLFVLLLCFSQKCTAQTIRLNGIAKDHADLCTGSVTITVTDMAVLWDGPFGGGPDLQIQVFLTNDNYDPIGPVLNYDYYNRPPATLVYGRVTTAGNYHLQFNFFSDAPYGYAPPVTITNTALAANLAKQRISTCGSGNDGAVTLIPTNGIAPYTYTLVSGSVSQTNNSGTFTGLGVGTYTSHVIDGNGCVTADSTYTLTTAPVLTVTGTAKPDKSCTIPGGSIKALRSGGVQPYSYTITGPGGSTATLTSATFTTFTGLAGGSYTIDVTDAAGCTATSAPVIVAATPATPIAKSTHTNPTCKNATDGIIIPKGAQGVAPYTFSLMQDTTPVAATGLPAGAYTLTVTDAGGCTSAPVVVTLRASNAICPKLLVAETVADAAIAVQPLAVTVLPNPSHTTFTLVVTGGKKEAVTLVVTDVAGRTVHQTKGLANQRYTFGQNFTAGMYFVRLVQGNETRLVKLLKQ